MALALTCAAAMGQTVSQNQLKADTAKKVKPQYRYFYEVPVRDFKQIGSALHDYKDGLIYNTLMDDQSVRERQIQISAYLATLPKIAKLDSVLVDSMKTRKKKPTTP